MAIYEITPKEKKLLDDIYYKKYLQFGRDKLYNYIKLNHPKSSISRRKVMYYLNQQPKYKAIHSKRTIKKIIKPTVKNHVKSYILYYKDSKCRLTVPRTELIVSHPNKIQEYESLNDVIWHKSRVYYNK